MPWNKGFNKYTHPSILKISETMRARKIDLATYTYNFSFSNRNQSLLDEVEKALIYLGFHPERREDAIRLRKKQEVENFKNLISFRKYTQ